MESSDPTEFRGAITDRGLTTALTRESGYEGAGIVEILGLRLEDLQGKKVLNVGVGAGRSLEQALKLGMDHYAVDIAPYIKFRKFLPFHRLVSSQVSTSKDRLRDIASRYLVDFLLPMLPVHC